MCVHTNVASSGPPALTTAAHHQCPIESSVSLSLRVMLGIRFTWSSTQLPTQRSISERTAGSLAPESNRSFALSLQCIVHLVRRSWGQKRGERGLNMMKTHQVGEGFSTVEKNCRFRKILEQLLESRALLFTLC